ncbi:MAG: hypothetical protein H7841_03835 [Magnetospirillum sp. WYHS-4]
MAADFQDHLTRAMALHRAGDAAASVAAYGEALLVNPENPDAWFLRALAHLDLGQGSECLDDLGRAIDLAPRLADYRLVRAEVLLASGGRIEDAIADLRAALAFAANDPRVLVALGKAERSREAWEDAEKHLGKAILLSPGDADLLKEYGETLQGLARNSGGADRTRLRNVFRQAIVVTKGDPRVVAASGEFLLGWAESLRESNAGEACRRVEEALSHPLPTDLTARCREFLDSLVRARQAETGRLRMEAFRTRMSKSVWNGAEPREVVEDRIVAAVNRRRSGLAPPDSDAFGSPPRPAKVEFAFHPYLGYAARPGWRGTTYRNNHGFAMEKPWFDYPYNGESGDDIVVALFGGSVADQFFAHEREKIRALVASILSPLGRPVTVLNFSQGGYGQPQAMLSYFYFRALGQRFDLAVNIDGFNEAMGKRANQRNGHHVSLPLSWMMNNLMLQFQAPSDDPEVLAFMGRLLVAQARVAALAERRGIVDRWRLKRARRELERLRGSTPVMAGNGTLEPFLLPRTDPVDDQVFSTCPRAARALADEVVDLWARASILLGRGCAADGVRYLHCLQPNPYFGGKPRSEEEMERYYIPGCAEYWAIAQTYPLMLGRADELATNGVDFFDLTGCFDGIAETLSIDAACHFNRRGNDIMFEALRPKLEDLAGRLIDGGENAH